MSLEDYFDVDLKLPNFPERVYGPPINLEMMNDRIHYLKGTSNKNNNTLPVVYWMSRDQRLHDNWAVLYAQRKALDHNLPFCIIFGLTSTFPGANIRSYGFMLRGLKLLQLECENYNIPFYILRGSPDDVVSKFCNDNNVGTLVTDFSPLNISKLWKRNISSRTATKLQFIEVDAHNICPVRKVSNKCEFAAKTIRSKIHGLVSEYLTEFPSVQVMNENTQRSHSWISPDITPVTSTSISTINNHNVGGDSDSDSDSDNSRQLNPIIGNKEIWQTMLTFINSVDQSVPEVTWLESGEHAAIEALNDFLGITSTEQNTTNRRTSRLDNFAEKRNDPSIIKGCSNLSPYLHYGQISSQRICLEVKRVKGFSTTNALFPDGERTTGVHSFCEELVVRKELSDNYCFYNENYSILSGAHNWAQTTLQEHWNDERPVLYSEEQLEKGKTGDDLWNAAQIEMVTTGKMHGFMRMYWAKKILEWTPTPDDALRIAIYLNDKYSLDGRDPNGYVGCMWAICGVHDRAWGPERPIFGKIRFMNYEGCKRKFNINSYIGMFLKAESKSTTTTATKKITTTTTTKKK